ncbi:MAG TPA: hypothetical protein VM577_01655 [Anaerovoracaceae bacterium]|nr:hypothetical protein [Anaerovoracaceae bacterium]
MAGYDYENLLSKNASADMEQGIVPHYNIPIPITLLRQYLKPRTWHHVGANFIKEPFYSEEEALQTFGIAEATSYPANQKAVDALARFNHEIDPPAPRQKTAYIPFQASDTAPGIIPSEYPYDINGRWSKPEHVRERYRLPLVDLTTETTTHPYIELQIDGKPVYLANARLEKLKSGYWRIAGVFIRYSKDLKVKKSLYLEAMKTNSQLVVFEQPLMGLAEPFTPTVKLIPDEYPYDIKGIWRCMDLHRNDKYSGLPVKDQVVEIINRTNIALNYAKKGKEPKRLEHKAVKVEFLQSGYIKIHNQFIRRREDIEFI